MKIIALGDSFTEGFLVDKNYTDYLADEGHDIINLGLNGDRTSGMLRRFVPEPSDILIIFGGSNDFFDSASAENTYKNVKSILDKSLSDQNIVVIPPYMEEIPEYPRYELINNSIDTYASLILNDEIIVIDARKIKPSYIDGLHMREDFHKELANKILEMI